MRSVDVSDADLIEETAEFHDLLMSYISGCSVLEEVESNAAREQDIAHVHCCLAVARQQWRSALHRLGENPARSEVGLLAKAGAIQEYLTEFPIEDAEAMALIGSLFADLRRLLGDVGQAPSNL